MSRGVSSAGLSRIAERSGTWAELSGAKAGLRAAMVIPRDVVSGDRNGRAAERMPSVTQPPKSGNRRSAHPRRRKRRSLQQAMNPVPAAGRVRYSVFSIALLRLVSNPVLDDSVST